jgi:hypothetical protein
MKPFANRRVSRNTAFAMLLVWLFALGSGVANACLLEAHRNRANGSPVAHSHQAGKGHEGRPAAHAGAIETHDAGSGASKPHCLKVCDDSSTSLVKHQPVFDQTDVAQAPFIALAWAAAIPADARLIRAGHSRHPEPGPPIRVLFSRLAL